jgi:DNA-binding NarL/FixJ family response regulator
MSVKIVLAEGHRLVRQGLRALLEQETGAEIVGEADDGRAAVTMVRDLKPHLLIIDTAMPGLNGIDATRQVRQEHPETFVIILSVHGDIGVLRESLKAGAHGFILKACGCDELELAIRTVLGRNPYVTPKATGELLFDYLNGQQNCGDGAFGLLTPREREIIQLVTEGYTNHRIGEALCISPKTVDCHRQRIMKKLNLHTAADLVKYAIREGLTS